MLPKTNPHPTDLILPIVLFLSSKKKRLVFSFKPGQIHQVGEWLKSIFLVEFLDLNKRGEGGG